MERVPDHADPIRRRLGAAGYLRRGLDKVVLRPLGVRFVWLLALEAADLPISLADEAFDVRLLRVEEVAHFASDPTNQMGAEFVERSRGGYDLCFGVLSGDRLAGYAWCALGSVEAAHAAGADLALPGDTAYLYKGFTHPDFRGRGLYPACMGAALSALRASGIERLVAFVHWHNTVALRSCHRAGYRDLGRMLIGPRGPLSVPDAVRALGIRVGAEAEVAPRG